MDQEIRRVLEPAGHHQATEGAVQLGRPTGAFGGRPRTAGRAPACAPGDALRTGWRRARRPRSPPRQPVRPPARPAVPPPRRPEPQMSRCHRGACPGSRAGGASASGAASDEMGQEEPTVVAEVAAVEVQHRGAAPSHIVLDGSSRCGCDQAAFVCSPSNRGQPAPVVPVHAHRRQCDGCQDRRAAAQHFFVLPSDPAGHDVEPLGGLVAPLGRPA